MWFSYTTATAYIITNMRLFDILHLHFDEKFSNFKSPKLLFPYDIISKQTAQSCFGSLPFKSESAKALLLVGKEKFQQQLMKEAFGEGMISNFGAKTSLVTHG